MNGEDIINQIIRTQPSFTPLCSHKSVLAIVTAGSLARNEYHAGWSDIDMLALIESPDLEYLQLLGNYGHEISEASGTKTTIQSLDGQILIKSMTDERLASMYQKFLKTFHNLRNKPHLPLYIREGYKLPEFTLDHILTSPLEASVTAIMNFMYKYMSDVEIWNHQKVTMRRIIKSILSLLQDIYLHKHHTLLENYDELILAIPEDEFRLPVFRRYFAQRKTVWPNLEDHQIPLTDLQAAWSELIWVADSIIRPQ